MQSQAKTFTMYTPESGNERNVEYDIRGKRVPPGERRQYVTTTVANALRAFLKFQDEFSGRYQAGDFEKVDPINAAIMNEYTHTHNVENDGILVENNDLAGLIVR
jgi:hypothetical protein